MRPAHLQHLAASVLLAWGGAAQAGMYLCVDASGHKNYQQSPCPSPSNDQSIQPVPADAMTEAGVRELVKRFDKGVSQRDAEGIARLITRDFVYTGFGFDFVGAKERFQEHAREFTSAIYNNITMYSKVSTRREPGKVTIRDGVGVYETKAVESGEVTSHKYVSKRREIYTVVLLENKLMLKELVFDVSEKPKVDTTEQSEALQRLGY